MGKNILTGWLHVMAKDFKILLKNKFLLLIYLSVIFALMLIGAFIAFYIYPQILDLFDLSATYPSIPNYMVLGVVFAVSIFLMSQGDVSISSESTIGTADRMKIMNMPYALMIVGKMLFYYLSAFIMMLIYNLSFLLLLSINHQGQNIMELWSLPKVLLYQFFWPLVMVLLAGLLYSIVQLFKTKKA